jgi:hypothetical protein
LYTVEKNPFRDIQFFPAIETRDAQFGVMGGKPSITYRPAVILLRTLDDAIEARDRLEREQTVLFRRSESNPPYETRAFNAA